jgi:YD repeat-containing protein
MGLCCIARLIVNRHRADPNFRPGAKLLALARVGEKEHDYQASEEYYKAATQITQVTFADSLTTQYVYDAGDRLTLIINSVAGTITRAYDGRNQLTSETTLGGQPQLHLRRGLPPGNDDGGGAAGGEVCVRRRASEDVNERA